MAILIPSKNIYNKQNPKIMDNVIDKLEIQATEINTKVERNTTVFSKNGTVEDFKETTSYTIVDNYENKRSTTEENALYNFSNFNDLYGNKAAFEYNLGWIIIKSTYLKFNVANTYYSDIRFPQLNSKNKIIQVEQPEFSYNLTKKVGSVSSFDITYGDKIGNTINNKVGSYFNNANIGNIEINYGEAETTADKLEEKLTVTYKSEGYNNVSDATLSLTVTNKDNTSEAEIPLYLGDKVTSNFYYLNKTIYFLIGVEIITITKNGYYSSTDQLNAFDITTAPQSEIVSANFTSSCTKYEADNISISIFGKTISIISNEKPIIVGNTNGEKPHAIDGNELMQTSNYKNETQELIANTDYWVGTSSNTAQTIFYTSVHLYEKYPLDTYIDYKVVGEVGIKKVVIKAFSITHSPAIESRRLILIMRVYRKKVNTIYNSFKDTQISYSNGKETATIRCSISDYYDYDNGDKVISVDNSTGKMSFKMYDEVIPMVYGADGKDHPMSLYKDGTPKVFQVLGTKIYYDGAVWQELSLQEV